MFSKGFNKLCNLMFSGYYNECRPDLMFFDGYKNQHNAIFSGGYNNVYN